MSKMERVRMIKAMEYIARQINDEEVFEGWLMCGVADGDIRYGDLTYDSELDDDELSYYYEDDDTFADMMELFLRKMTQARKSGGLYCDNVVSKEKKYE